MKSPARSARTRIVGALRRLGVDVGRRHPRHIEIQIASPHMPPVDRARMKGAFTNLARLGYAPTTVFDIGAATGTPPLYAAFPLAHHVLVEPLVECEHALRLISAELLRSDLFLGVVGSASRDVTLNVHADLSGTSLLRENEGGGINGAQRKVPQSTLDQLAEDFQTSGPYFVKVDTQGSELDVLKGAERVVLPETTGLYLETSLMQFFEGGPLIQEIVAYMHSHDFSIYDVVDLQYRPLDGAMSQVDLLFLRTDSHLRHDQRYASVEQRRAADRRRR